jgi:branched-chain amino acid transport system substrate-binding protein
MLALLRLGPLAAYELLGISDYVAAHKTPMMSLAAADNITQRKLNPYFVRASATSSQAMHPMGHFAATEMKLKRVTTLVADFAFGYEQMGGFQEVFEKYGGRVVKKLWAPIVTADYAPTCASWPGAVSTPARPLRPSVGRRLGLLVPNPPSASWAR